MSVMNPGATRAEIDPALPRAGVHSAEKHELAHDIQNNWYVVRK